MHVDDEWRVGEVDGGWQVMLVALSFERGVAGGVRDAERLLTVAEEHARDRGRRRRPSAARRPRPASRRSVRLAIDCEVADLLAEPRGVGGGARAGSPASRARRRKLFATEALSSARPTGCSTPPGPAGLVQSHDVTELERVLRVLLPLRARHHDLRRYQRDPAQPRSPNAGSACRARADGRADGARGSPTSGSRPSSTTFRDQVREFLAGALAPARTVGHRDPTDLTGWDEAFERDAAAARRARPACSA